MRRGLAATAAAALVAVASPSYAGGHHGRVTFPEYQSVKVGQYRDHVQRSFGTNGHPVALWADARHLHLVKTYPTDTADTRVQVTYVGPSTQHPFAGPFRVVSKALVTS